MVLCPTCGADNEDNAQACRQCGQPFIQVTSQPVFTSYATQSSAAISGLISNDEYIFAELTEIVASKENPNLKVNAFVTNRRLYHNTQTLSINKSTYENVVNLEDVVAVSYVDVNPRGFLVGGIICLVISIICLFAALDGAAAPAVMLGSFLFFGIMLLIAYFTNKRTSLLVNHRAGTIRIRTANKAAALDFQKKVFLAKDLAKKL